MNLNLTQSDLQTMDIAGSDRSWRDRAKQLCQKAKLNLERLVKEAVRIFNPELRNGRLKSEQHRAWTAFLHKKSPSVPHSLRRVVAYLLQMFNAGKTLPIAVS